MFLYIELSSSFSCSFTVTPFSDIIYSREPSVIRQNGVGDSSVWRSSSMAHSGCCDGFPGLCVALRSGITQSMLGGTICSTPYRLFCNMARNLWCWNGYDAVSGLFYLLLSVSCVFFLIVFKIFCVTVWNFTCLSDKIHWAGCTICCG